LIVGKITNKKKGKRLREGREGQQKPKPKEEEKEKKEQ